MQKQHRSSPAESGFWKLFSAGVLLALLSLCFAGCAGSPAPAQLTTHPSQQSGCSGSISSARQPHVLYVAHATFVLGPKFSAVTALDVNSGKKIWQTTIAQGGSEPLSGSLQVVDGVVYTVYSTESVRSAVIALDAKDGHILWQYQPDAQTYISRLVVCHGTMYLNMEQRGTTSFEVRRTRDAGLLWRYTSPTKIMQSAITDENVYLLTLALREKSTHIPREGAQCYDLYGNLRPTCETASTLTALGASDGKPRWHSAAYVNAFFPVPPMALAATDQAVYLAYPFPKKERQPYISEWSSAVDALQATDGSVLWQQAQVDLSYAYPNSAVFNGLLYLTALNHLAAINVSDGKQLWISSGVYSVELNAGNGFLYTKGGKFCAVEASSGKAQWCINHPDTGFVTVASASAVYSSLGFEGTVYALQQANGKELWHFTPEPDHRVFGMALDQ